MYKNTGSDNNSLLTREMINYIYPCKIIRLYCMIIRRLCPCMCILYMRSELYNIDIRANCQMTKNSLFPHFVIHNDKNL